ncbi:MAG: hypothetical protein AB1411_11005 [Nitrospirota bacterium]
MPEGTPPTQAVPAGAARQTQSFSWAKLIHFGGAGLLIAAGLAYWLWKPPSLNPMADPQAAEAMALVQTHRARQAPTLRQAVTDRVRAMEQRGQGVRVGEWRVEKQQGPRGEFYLVTINIREEGAKQWFEREYVWQVDLANRSIVPLSMPAEDLMPLGEGGPMSRGGTLFGP